MKLVLSKQTFTKTFVIICLLCFSMLSNAQSAKEICTQKVNHIFRLLKTEKFDSVYMQFNRDMQGEIDQEQLEGIWNGFIMEYDTITLIEKTRVSIEQNLYLTITPVTFGKRRFGIQLNFDSALQKIVGLFFVNPDVQYNPGNYVHNDAFVEYKIPLKSKGYETEAILSVPNKNRPSKGYPLAIIAHGSGGIDKDLTYGPNKVYKDLAWGLASMGVACLRYDKRSKHLLKQMIEADKNNIEKFTIENEYLYDLKSAIKLMRKREDINAHKIFIIGHSEGAYLIPRFNHSIKSIAGFVSMAGTFHPIAMLAIDQIKYLMPDSILNDSLKSMKINILRSIENSLPQNLRNDFTNDSVMKPWPLNYWKYLAKYNAEKEGLKITKPLLVLQGERDYQVRYEEMLYIQTIMKEKPNVIYKSYPELNHLFLRGKGKLSKPSEYEEAGNIPSYVIEDIRNFILK